MPDDSPPLDLETRLILESNARAQRGGEPTPGFPSWGRERGKFCVTVENIRRNMIFMLVDSRKYENLILPYAGTKGFATLPSFHRVGRDGRHPKKWGKILLDRFFNDDRAGSFDKSTLIPTLTVSSP